MTVYELNRDQLDELKQSYVCEKVDCPSYGELADAVDISDEVVQEYYADYEFTSDDFFCTAGGCNEE